MSTCFTIYYVTYVAHQSGILPPTLLSIYMDEPSLIVSESGIGVIYK